ncbi:TatD family hydrolase [Opitutus terrae]|uniref:TatD-related deoxyribonuclease n=1 Tax=Opitutus terrae (strain DSM 11246 / JCM 15787 / PB90-1) TaxID=452637 RepID=B1ZPD6_OPITP|nr:TatD family hydrolase [Opitutus terrae]ACB73541.1 TatD-related deoxyribonuclease [Opitutus terrae PB90-1]
MISLFDAHNHLQDAWLAPHRDRVLADLPPAGVAACVVNGTSEADWPDVAQLCASATALLTLLPSYGLHPWNVGNAAPGWREQLLRHLDSGVPTGALAAVGEIGLDRWILDRARPDDSRLAGLRRAPLEEQIIAFTWQLELAAERDLPATIHCLDAWGALHEVLRRTRLPARGFLLHAYGGSAELAREFAALGAYFSFNGYFLGERQAARRAIFKTLPLDRLLVETDAPAMPLPASHRTHELPGLADGNPINHPANLGAVYAGLAELRGMPLEELAPQIEKNFRRLFGAPTPAPAST